MVPLAVSGSSACKGDGVGRGFASQERRFFGSVNSKLQHPQFTTTHTLPRRSMQSLLTFTIVKSYKRLSAKDTELVSERPAESGCYQEKLLQRSTGVISNPPFPNVKSWPSTAASLWVTHFSVEGPKPSRLLTSTVVTSKFPRQEVALVFA